MSATKDLYAGLELVARQYGGATARLAAEICEVPAPTGAEHERAACIANLWEARGCTPEVDDTGNVIVRRGRAGGPTLMLAAHLDTVFPRSTALKVRRNGGRLIGPGIGDNSLGLAALLTLSDIIDEVQVELPVEVDFVADVGEEGLGNLAGVRAAVDRRLPQLGAFVAVEGHNLGRITQTGVASKRWRIRMQGPGGHSWGAYGQPSAIHQLAAVVTDLASRELPDSPRTTFNVGLMSGGTSVNTIAADAEATIDMRSTDAAYLEDLATDVKRTLERFASQEVEYSIDVLGERPGGQLPPDHRLVEIARSSLSWVGVQPVLDASSTDANYPLSLGIPSICIGITRGGRGHTDEEYISTQPIATGLAQLCRLVIDAADWLSESA